MSAPALMRIPAVSGFYPDTEYIFEDIDADCRYHFFCGP